MSGSVVLLHLAGAVALMLFATRMVRTGVERAYGDVLRHRLRATMRNPMLAVLAGTGARHRASRASTAVTLLVGSFAGAGIVSGLAGQLAVRGAEIGSALVVKLLTFDLSLLVPVCAGRRHDDVHRDGAPHLAPARPHPRRHRSARPVAADDRRGRPSRCATASCCR